jgi:hypothetical protein
VIRQIKDESDRIEAKIEGCATADTGKKRGKAKDDKKAEKGKIDGYKATLERVQVDLQNLEVAMRLITNEKINVKNLITNLKEPLDMYVEMMDPENDDDPANYQPAGQYDGHLCILFLV